MAEIFVAGAIALMVLGVIGSVTPMVPGALLSIAGIITYWYGTGYTRPETWFMVAFILTGLFAVAMDYLAGVVAARIGGASTRTSIISGIAGFLLFFLIGLIGILLGVAVTVLALEFRRTEDLRSSGRSALYSSIGVLGSTVIQLAITVALLLAFVTALIF